MGSAVVAMVGRERGYWACYGLDLAWMRISYTFIDMTCMCYHLLSAPLR